MMDKDGIVINEQTAALLITQQFRNIDVKIIERYGSGWDNVAYLVNNAYIFRFPQRSLAGDFMKTEICFLPKLDTQIAAHLIPKVAFIGKPSDMYPWPFVGYCHIPGYTADSLSLTHDERRANIPMIAAFLSQLHNIDADLFLAQGAPLDTLSRLSVSVRKPMTLNSLTFIQQHGLLDVKTLIAYVQDFNSEWAEPPACVCHGDLYSKHVILNSEKKLCGVIDWGDLHIGNPAIDLSFIHSFLSYEDHCKFIKHYGPVCEKIWALARFRAVFSSSTLSKYAHEINDTNLLRESLKSLMFITHDLSENISHVSESS